MLNSLLINNFRLFKHLKVDSLSQVNLFVGKNNTGKSCLLEAIQLYASNANVGVMLDIVSARDGYWETEIEQRDEQTIIEIEHPLRYLFHGYHFPIIGEEGITVGSGKDILRIQTRAYQLTQDKEGRRIRKPVDKPESQ